MISHTESLFEFSFSMMEMGASFYWAFLHKFLQNNPEITREKADASTFIPLALLIPMILSSIEFLIDNCSSGLSNTFIWVLSRVVPIAFVHVDMLASFLLGDLLAVPAFNWNNPSSDLISIGFVVIQFCLYWVMIILGEKKQQWLK